MKKRKKPEDRATPTEGLPQALPPALLRQLADGRLSLTIHVQPRASRNRMSGLHGEAVKLSITAPPVEGKANEAVLALIADIFKIPKSAVDIACGESSRSKRLLLSGLSIKEAEARLLPLLAIKK